MNKEDVVIAKEYWISQEDIEQFQKFRDILYCKYAIKEEMNNKNNLVDMQGLKAWAEKLEKLRKDFNV